MFYNDMLKYENVIFPPKAPFFLVPDTDSFKMSKNTFSISSYREMAI